MALGIGVEMAIDRLVADRQAMMAGQIAADLFWAQSLLDEHFNLKTKLGGEFAVLADRHPALASIYELQCPMVGIHSGLSGCVALDLTTNRRSTTAQRARYVGLRRTRAKCIPDVKPFLIT